MSGYKNQFPHMFCTTHEGPLVLIDGELHPEDRELAAQIVSRYTQGKHADKVNIQLSQTDGTNFLLSVAPLKPEDIKQEWKL